MMNSRQWPWVLDWMFIQVRYLPPTRKRMKELRVERDKMTGFLRAVRLAFPLKDHVRNARNENHVGVEVPRY